MIQPNININLMGLRINSEKTLLGNVEAGFVLSNCLVNVVPSLQV